MNWKQYALALVGTNGLMIAIGYLILRIQSLPIEELAEYKEAVPVVEEIIKENLGELYGCVGSCHTIWQQRKQLLMEKYGIEWFPPAELNRDVDFD